MRLKVEQQIEAELLHGNYILPTRPPCIISALGAICKEDSQSVRLIHDCSQPIGAVVNDYADDYSFQYQSLDDAVALIRLGCFLAKVDLKAAYHSIPIHPDCYDYTGLQWHFAGDCSPTVLVDAKLPFGATLSPSVFHRISQAIRRMMECKGVFIVAYLDDFCIIASNQPECQAGLNCFIELLSDLCLYVAWQKLEGPSTRITFLGVVIDSRIMRLELPVVKVQQLQQMLSAAVKRKGLPKQELQSILGKLSWAACVVRGGRTFL